MLHLHVLWLSKTKSYWNFTRRFFSCLNHLILMTLKYFWANWRDLTSLQVIDPKFFWKLKATSIYFGNNSSVFIRIYPFQPTYFFVLYDFYLRSTVYMFSKMVWNHNLHKFVKGLWLSLLIYLWRGNKQLSGW